MIIKKKTWVSLCLFVEIKIVIQSYYIADEGQSFLEEFCVMNAEGRTDL
jgi:hypothetical protein